MTRLAGGGKNKLGAVARQFLNIFIYSCPVVWYDTCSSIVKTPRDMTNTKHFSNDMSYRQYVVENLIGGYGNVVLKNVIDRGHRNGPERFELTDNGIIIVYNDWTDRRITILIARVGQLYSRFGEKFKSLPDSVQSAIKAKCQEWEIRGYNNA